MITIGLTGGIGSGKSAVAAMLSEMGAPVLDADKVGHAIYQPGGPAYAEVVAAFGDGVLTPNRAVDRRKLGALVFADPAALDRLNSIVHPKMFQRMREMVAEMRAGGEKRPIVIEAAILIEANWQPLCDEIWVISAARDQVVARVERDRAMKREQAEARIRAQLPDHQRRSHATLVIENNGTLEELRAKVTRLWHEALERNRQ